MIRFLLTFIFIFCFAREDKPIRPFRLSGFAQGTSYQITYYSADSLVSRKQTDSIFVKIDSSLSIYKPYSLISRFNNSVSGIPVDAMLTEVVKRSLQIHEKTNGAFDITVQPLVQAWGFGAKRIITLPDSAQIRSLLHCVGSGNLRLRQNRLTKSKPCLGIDVNGIAQGYSVDLIAAFLESKGITVYLVELGGEIRMKGRKPAGEAMTVGIESPGDDPSNPLPFMRTIRMEEGAVTTSGNYRKYYQNGLRKITHLIDSKTGYPIENELISVTVVSDDAMTADGYDNALMTMGLKKGLRFVKKQKNLEAYFIYKKADGSVADTASAGFYKLFVNQAD